MKRPLRTMLCLLLAVAASHGVRAAEACSDPAYRQFDFWIGEWTVHKPDGSVAGTSRIERAYGGCVLHEHYSTPRGYSGESFNVYDAPRKVWHQTWVDSTGLLLLLEGQLVAKRMVLSGQTLGPGGATTKHRITWTPNADGTVRQLWESTDAKGEWTTASDGLYRKKP